eukprot:202348_1
MTMSNGSFVFLDTILDNNVFFTYDTERCVICCYDVLCRSNFHSISQQEYISQLHIECSNNDSDASALKPLTINQSSLTNHTTPYYIYFDYDENYLVDSDFYLSFMVADQFGNTVPNYKTPITIWFANDVLQIHNETIVYLPDNIVLDPIVTNRRTGEHFIIDADANHHELVTGNAIDIVIVANDPKYKEELYLLLLLIPPCMILIICYVRRRKEYMDAFVVNKALVLIIGISQFDNRKLFLPGVKRSVARLVHLWRDVYHFDVNVCEHKDDPDTMLYCTKMDILNFVDEQKLKLEHNIYNGVIVHIITHGAQDDSFLTSDSKRMTTDFIQHEVIEYATSEMIKVVYHHKCRGSANHSRSQRKSNTEHSFGLAAPLIRTVTDADRNIAVTEMQSSSNNPVNERNFVTSVESNWVDIYGTIKGRTVSDEDIFADCVCEAFERNATRIIKKNFKTLTTDFGYELETRTYEAELCTVTSSVRYHQVRYQPAAQNNGVGDAQPPPIQSSRNGKTR